MHKSRPRGSRTRVTQGRERQPRLLLSAPVATLAPGSLPGQLVSERHVTEPSPLLPHFLPPPTQLGLRSLADGDPQRQLGPPSPCSVCFSSGRFLRASFGCCSSSQADLQQRNVSHVIGAARVSQSRSLLASGGLLLGLGPQRLQFQPSSAA